ncbi:MAG: hypothetical protein OHK93_000531 [Ramalina farinacea]|uniref:Uncharacterized protein n=1 Tax=Ramalina farinacea TaxID=258253 RepID=A0AA43QGT3_9LECA|nr:hypothetical protein [Ramalina farinacea]
MESLDHVDSWRLEVDSDAIQNGHFIDIDGSGDEHLWEGEPLDVFEASDFSDFNGIHATTQLDQASFDPISPSDSASQRSIKINDESPDSEGTTFRRTSPRASSGDEISNSSTQTRSTWAADINTTATSASNEVGQRMRSTEVKLLNGNPFDLTHEEEIDDSESLTSIPIEPNEAMPNWRNHPSPSRRLVRVSRGPTSICGAISAETLIPIFPWLRGTTSCRRGDCPIKTRHEEGPYLHDGNLRTREGNMFGASNPPPDVYEAYDRLKLGTSTTQKDSKKVLKFVKYHFGYTDPKDLDFVEKRGGPRDLVIPGKAVLGPIIRAWRMAS